MKSILFYAFLVAAQPIAGTQEFDDRRACETARDAIADNLKGTGFCVDKSSDQAADETPAPEPARASGGSSAKAPTARK
jgi:hypothetical protein